MLRAILSFIRDAGQSKARLLRTISVWTFVPALIFNFIHVIVFYFPLPVAGLLPHACSVGIALYELGGLEWLTKKTENRYSLIGDPTEDEPSAPQNLPVVLLDVVAAALLITCTAFSYLAILADPNRRYYTYDASVAIVGAYAILPYIVNA